MKFIMGAREKICLLLSNWGKNMHSPPPLLFPRSIIFFSQHVIWPSFGHLWNVLTYFSAYFGKSEGGIHIRIYHRYVNETLFLGSYRSRCEARRDAGQHHARAQREVRRHSCLRRKGNTSRLFYFNYD